MSRKLIALLVASALAIGSSGAGVQTAAASVTQTAQPAVIKNEPPLKPGRAAGIREAQGTADVDLWFITGLIVAGIVAAILLAHNDDDFTGGTDGD